VLDAAALIGCAIAVPANELESRWLEQVCIAMNATVLITDRTFVPAPSWPPLLDVTPDCRSQIDRFLRRTDSRIGNLCGVYRRIGAGSCTRFPSARHGSGFSSRLPGT
jgi:hypothetical protein